LIWNNDSGGSSALHASGADGKIIKTVSLNGFQNIDYEAMALGPCPDRAAESCIYLGDIGDNREWRSSYRIGIFKEKDFWTKNSIMPMSVITYNYPNQNFNAESMIVTPEGKIIVFTKNKSGVSRIFEVSLNVEVKEIGEIDVKKLTGSEGRNALLTDASLSPDRKRILLLTYDKIIEFDVSAVLKNTGRIPIKEEDYAVIQGPGLVQQETITYVTNDSFLVSTETKNDGVADIFLYRCTDKKIPKNQRQGTH
jgi:hypothetical protein